MSFLVGTSYKLAPARVPSYTYNGNGSLLSDPKNLISDIVYDHYSGQPLRKQEFFEVATDYRYNSAGRGTFKQTSSMSYHYLGDIVITDGNGLPLRFNIADGFATLDGSGKLEKHYQLTDWLGTPRLGIDEQGSVTDTKDYYPFGKPMPGRFFSSSYEDRRFQFTGHEHDEENNHDYHGARYYQRDIARYLTVDPMSDQRSWLTPYNYVQNNPLNRVDPTGMLDHGYEVDLDNKTVKKVSDKGGEETHYFDLVKKSESKEVVSSYELDANEFGLVPFPESGENWGRYGSRDAGGDNWVSPKTAGAFFGLLADWKDDPLTSEVYFDDISPRDGKTYIGHATHRTGDDIDIRYFGAGDGPNTNGGSADCSTCWNTISGQGSNASDVLYYSTYNFLSIADKWGFNQNYAYPSGFSFTEDKAHFIHRHHLHIGRR